MNRCFVFVAYSSLLLSFSSIFFSSSASYFLHLILPSYSSFHLLPSFLLPTLLLFPLLSSPLPSPPHLPPSPLIYFRFSRSFLLLPPSPFPSLSSSSSPSSPSYPSSPSSPLHLLLFSSSLLPFCSSPFLSSFALANVSMLTMLLKTFVLYTVKSLILNKKQVYEKLHRNGFNTQIGCGIVGNSILET